jgi:hypothetical protein
MFSNFGYRDARKGLASNPQYLELHGTITSENYTYAYARICGRTSSIVKAAYEYKLLLVSGNKLDILPQISVRTRSCRYIVFSQCHRNQFGFFKSVDVEK